MITSLGSAGAPWTITHTSQRVRSMICGTGTSRFIGSVISLICWAQVGLTRVNSYAKSGQPLLISLHFNAPHWPWEAPGDEAESKRVAGTNLRDFDGVTQKTYQRMIEAMDAQIGRVLETLDVNCLTENTIVIL